MSQPEEPITALLAIARRAGDAILDHYDADYRIQQKPDRSPVTDADFAAHRVIEAGLTALEPRLPVLSEESGPIPFAVRRGWSRYWLVDPLDGTREFIKRNDEFTVNIALIEGHAPRVGLIYAPVTGLCYYATRGDGAWRIEPGGAPQPIRVSEHCAEPVRVVGSRSHAGANLLRFLDRVGDHEVTKMGSSLKSCLVAEGSADIYARLGPTSEWDTGAAQAIVEEAGGLITDTRMRPLRYNTKDSLLNPHFFVFGDRGVDWSRFLPDLEPDPA